VCGCVWANFNHLVSSKLGHSQGVAKGAMSPPISITSCHFVLGEAVSQTKWCCLVKVEIFATKNFELATPLVQCVYSIHMEQGASTWVCAHGSLPEVAGVTLSDSDSTHVLKFSNLDPGTKVFQTWESDSFSDSVFHRCNRNLAMFLLKEWHL